MALTSTQKSSLSKSLSKLASTQSSSSSSGAGAVNKSGQIIGAGGQVVGTANPADTYGTSNVHPKGYTGLSWGQMEEQGIIPQTGGATEITPETPQEPKTAYTGTSIVDALNQSGQPSDFASRANLAQMGGIQGYTGTAEQNTSLLEKYRAGHLSAQQSGVSPVTKTGGAAAKEFLPQTREDSPAITSFFDKAVNPIVDEQMTKMMEWLSPEADRKMLNESITQLSADRKELAGLKTDLMDINRIMDGTRDDLVKEIEAGGGLATSSQIDALTIGRNNILLKKAQLISDQIQSQTDIVNADISLIGDEKQIAAQQFSQRMSLLQYKQQNNQNMMNAARGSIETLLKTDGGINAYLSNPAQSSYAEQIMGWAPGTIKSIAATSQQEKASQLKMEELSIREKEASISNIYSQIADRNKKDTEDTKINDAKIELKTQGAVVKADIILTNINKALTQASGMSTGLFSGVSKKVPGTTSYNLNKTLTTIKSNIGFQELQAMRESSPTGGALGQVAVQELEALQATLGSLDIGQSQSQLTENLKAVQNHYANWLRTVGYEVTPNGDIVKIKL